MTCNGRQPLRCYTPRARVAFAGPDAPLYDSLPSTVGVFERWVGNRCGCRLRVYGAARVGVIGSSRLAAAYPAGAWLAGCDRYVQVCAFLFCCLFPFFPGLFWVVAQTPSAGVAASPINAIEYECRSCIFCDWGKAFFLK